MATFAPDEKTAEMGSSGIRESRRRDMPAESFNHDGPPKTDGQPGSLEKFVLDPEGFMLNDCNYRDEGLKHPLGWSRLAAMPDQFNNMDMFRDFSYPSWRLVHYKGARLAFLSNELRKFDKENTKHRRGLTKNQTRPPGHPPILDDYDTLIIAIDEACKEYWMVLNWVKEARQLHPVPREQYRDVLEHMADMGMLDKDGYIWMDSPDEFVSFSAPPPPWVIRFLYSPLGKWIIKKLSPRTNDAHSWSLPEITLIFMLKALQLIGAAMLLLTPVGILFLNELPRLQAFGVVVGSTIVFSAVVTVTHEVDTHKMLLEVCAYMAIMVAFAVASD